MRAGGDYERFVYEKFERLFPDAQVTLNDMMLGRQSGLLREIDISIKMKVGDTEIVYIVQCKDRARRPADIVILGEFSSVIKDVGATKGFLICTSGFAKSNHKYARTLGIELLTVEDAKSERWNADIEVPLIYKKKTVHYAIDARIIVNEALVAKNQGQPIRIDLDIDTAYISHDLGETKITIREYLDSWIAKAGSFLKDAVDIDLMKPGLRLDIAGIWVECNDLVISLTTERTYYLKYLAPDEYSQVRDHRRDARLPLHMKLSGPGGLDESFIEVPETDLPVKPLLFVELEEWTVLEKAQGKGQPAANHPSVPWVPPFVDPHDHS